MRERIREVKEVIDTKIKSKRIYHKRIYHDGDIVEFDFEPNSIDIYWHDITLIGVISGVLYEKDSISYKVQLRDNRREIFGELIVPERAIKRKIEDNVVTVKCDFCERRIHINLDDTGLELEKWGKIYCTCKSHHILNICPQCADNKITDIEQEKCRCPYDNYVIISEKRKRYLEDHGIKLVDKI